jgi:hypothetical protein
VVGGCGGNGPNALGPSVEVGAGGRDSDGDHFELWVALSSRG